MGSNVILSALWICLLPIAVARVVRRDSTFGVEAAACGRYTLGGLLTLDCSNRGLTELPNDLEYDAQVLLLSSNNFRIFPSQLNNFTRVQTLDLSSNYLSEPLPDYLQNWVHFTTLNLSNNLYESWSGTESTFTLKNLDLSKNKIGAIDDRVFTTMPSLQFLDLSENRLNELPRKIFSETHNIYTLILRRNYISAIPNFQSSSLRSLQLSNCQISKLNADSLVGLSSLLELDLSMNQIEEIPDNITSTTLQELNLSYNSINSLTDQTFLSLPHLAVLDLRGNEFREVWSTSHFASNHFLREVYVKGNRWNCEGFSVNLLLTYEFLTKEPAKIVDRESLICYYPSNVTQMSWQQAYIRTWHASESTNHSYTTIAVIAGIIIGVLITSCVCRSMVAVNGSDESRRPVTTTTVLSINGETPQPRAESVVLRIPLTEDLPPSYDEALLMPRLNSSFHSLPDFVEEDEEPSRNRNYRRSRSIGDLTEFRPRVCDRRSIRRPVDIHNISNGRITERDEY